jgi:hypothetical protein
VLAVKPVRFIHGFAKRQKRRNGRTRTSTENKLKLGVKRTTKGFNFL